MKIYGRDLASFAFSFELSLPLWITVEEFKLEIFNQRKLPPKYQHIFVNGAYLEDETKSLAFYHTQEESNISLLFVGYISHDFKSIKPANLDDASLKGIIFRFHLNESTSNVSKKIIKVGQKIKAVKSYECKEGRFLVAGTDQGAIHVYDGVTLKKNFTFEKAFDKSILSLSNIVDGQIMSGSTDGKIIKFDLKTNQIVQTWKIDVEGDKQ